MENVATYLFTQGVLGVVVAALIIDRSGIIKKTDRLQEKIDELQDLRLADTKEVAKEVTSVLQANTQSNLILAEKIEIAKNSGVPK